MMLIYTLGSVSDYTGGSVFFCRLGSVFYDTTHIKIDVNDSPHL